MTRKDKILQHVDASGRGIEIGPHNPIAPKKEGFNVAIIDTLTREGLRKKYEAHAVDRERIEEVDYVWSGQRYPELVPAPHDFDWIIASHVIEHTPDLIAFLNDCAELLAPAGVLSLAIPDKRYCFDCLRPISGLGAVVDAHARRLTNHSPGIIAEFMLNAVAKNGAIAWEKDAPGDLKFLCTLGDVTAHLHEALATPSALDVHAWCFTPGSFRLLINDLNLLGLIGLREIGFHPTSGSEFYVTLGKRGATPSADRLQFLRSVEE